MSSPEAIESAYDAATQRIDDAVNKLEQEGDVAYTSFVGYDTLPIGKEQYGEILERTVDGESGDTGANWFPASRVESLQAAISRYRGGAVRPAEESEEVPSGSSAEPRFSLDDQLEGPPETRVVPGRGPVRFTIFEPARRAAREYSEKSGIPILMFTCFLSMPYEDTFVFFNKHAL